ncbi:hypothetical protein AnigIFM60653_009928 [Aspergillus niger]|nr:hypothetical protein AnigIFM60653_009928 [Aspergillus niger]
MCPRHRLSVLWSKNNPGIANTLGFFRKTPCFKYIPAAIPRCIFEVTLDTLSKDEKDRLAQAITENYVRLGIPAFLVNIGTFYSGGQTPPNTVFFVLDHTARPFPSEKVRLAFINSVNEMVQPILIVNFAAGVSCSMSRARTQIWNLRSHSLRTEALPTRVPGLPLDPPPLIQPPAKQLEADSGQSLLALVRKHQQPIPIPDCPDHRIPPMEPHRMLRGSKPSKMSVEIITEIVAAAQQQKRKHAGEMGRLFPVIVVNDEDIDKTSHCSAHAQRAENQSPHNLVEKISSTAHYEDAHSEEYSFGKERIEPEQQEGSEIDTAPLLGDFDVLLSRNQGLVG